MKLFTTTLAVALLSQIGTAYAGDDVYVTYTNKTNISLEILFDTGKTDCFYQSDIPSDIIVQPGQSVGPFYGQSKASGACFFERGDFTLDILWNNFHSISQCEFIQGLKYNTYEPHLPNCPNVTNPKITVNSDTNNNKIEIVVGPFAQTTHMNQHQMVAPPHVGREIEHYNTSRVNPMRNMAPPHHALPRPNINHSRVAPPHAGHEVEHYNTSRVNPMMHQHKMEFHRPEPMMKNRKVENAKPMIHKR